MRRILPLGLVLVATAFVWPRAERPPVPRQANITAACTPSQNPGVNPSRIDMARVDNVEWREPSGRAVSWTITPKNAEDWLFPQTSYTGSRGGAAVTPQPVPGALANHPYRYMITIQCPDTTQIIDPDIVIGEAEDS